jgi:hypothetical protein
MSYDLEIGTHREPTRGQVEAWAAERELTVEADDDGFVVSRVLKRGDGHLFRVDGPVAAESDDFVDAVAAACLAPRWMTRLEVPYGTPKAAVTLARALAYTDPGEDGTPGLTGRDEVRIVPTAGPTPTPTPPAP